jgi:hypothetical protein
MNDNRFPVEAVRSGIQTISETVAHQSTTPPPPEEIYVVLGHEQALNPETTLVIGDRGSGKSFWSAALNGDESRVLIGRQLRRLRLETVYVSWGFSAGQANPDHPSRRVLRQLLGSNFEVEDIWRAVILHQLAQRYGPTWHAKGWPERVRFVSDSPEQEEHMLAEMDDQLGKQGMRHLVVFDALDRSGPDWRTIRDLVKGLLRVCLDLRSYQHIRTKLFMRPDMFEDRAIWAFPDASKLHHGRVMLEWRRMDLYGLLWHWLANQRESGESFRRWCEQRHSLRFDPVEAGNSTVYALPMRLRTDEKIQAELLKDMASTYMGRDRRRGHTYTWLPNHLADAKGQVSPRSFLLAIKRGETASRERTGQQVLYWEGIKQGVQQASRVRLQELQEDYPWIQRVLDPLRGMTVPGYEDDLTVRWRQANVINAIEQAQVQALMDGDDKMYLAPHAMDEQTGGDKEAGLVAALIEVGVISRLADGRLNIPDLFRVAAGIGRKGGVRAIR